MFVLVRIMNDGVVMLERLKFDFHSATSHLLCTHLIKSHLIINSDILNASDWPMGPYW